METIYIVSYRSYEDDDSYAFRNKEKALTDVKNDMCNTINILESQGYKPEIAQDTDFHKEIYVPHTGIYHEWNITKSTLE